MTVFYRRTKKIKIFKLPWAFGLKQVKIKKKDGVIIVMFFKFFVTLIIFLIKPTCFKKHE